MNTLRIRNVHVAIPLAVSALKATGVRRDSRNGPVLMSPDPVTTVYERPLERVTFWAERDANPYFHFFEKLWMLGGKFDVKSVARFAGGMARYSDDGETFHGTYGRRWRVGMPHARGVSASHDQLPVIIDRLKNNRDDRRSVLQMWDAESDLNNPSKDVPCNTTATFQVGVDGRLNMVVFNRSNDIIWGCYGANAVHFSGLLEYVAMFAGYPVGTYTQVSVNWHAYIDVFDKLWEKFEATIQSDFDPDVCPEVADLAAVPCPYATGQVKPYPMMTHGDPCAREFWDQDLQYVLRHSGRAPRTDKHWVDPFFPEVVLPILRSHDCFKQLEGEQRYVRALAELESCRATDWRLACQEWISRRFAKWVDDDGKG